MSARTYIGSVRVALLDDHALVRKGLVAQLEKSPSIIVVGSHGSSKPFRALLAGMPVDVALIDYSLRATTSTASPWSSRFAPRIRA